MFQEFISYIVTQFGPYVTSENLSLLVGMVMPFVITLLNKYIPDTSKYRSAMTWCVSGAVGLITVAVAGQFDLHKLVPSILAAYGSSQLIYRFWFKGSNVESKLQKE